MLGLAGVTEMDTSVAAVTVRLVVPEMLPEVAVRVVVPAARADTLPVALIDATVGAEELHVTDERAVLLPSF